MHTLGDTARAVLWRKNNPRKELFVVHVGTLQVLKTFDPDKWSFCIFFEDTAPEGDDVKQPPPSVPMQQDSTLPGPDPGHGPSDPPGPPLPPPDDRPGPPPPPDGQDDIVADDESLDPGDEFGDPDLPILPPNPQILPPIPPALPPNQPPGPSPGPAPTPVEPVDPVDPVEPIDTDHLDYDHLIGKRSKDEMDPDEFWEDSPHRRRCGKRSQPDRERSPHRADREFHWDPWSHGPPAMPASAGIPQTGPILPIAGGEDEPSVPSVPTPAQAPSHVPLPPASSVPTPSGDNSLQQLGDNSQSQGKQTPACPAADPGVSTDPFIPAPAEPDQNDDTQSVAETIPYPENINLGGLPNPEQDIGPEDFLSADDGDTGHDPDDSNQDLYVDEHPQVWSYLSEALKYASRASSFTRPEKPLSKLDTAMSNSLYCGELFIAFTPQAKRRKRHLPEKKRAQ